MWCAMGEEVPDWYHMWGAKVKTPVDMPDDMLKDAIEITARELDTIAQKAKESGDPNIDPLDMWGQDAAKNVKSEFDKKWTPYWHVIIGRNFGSFVTHETRMFIYFYYGSTVRPLAGGFVDSSLKRAHETNRAHLASKRLRLGDHAAAVWKERATRWHEGLAEAEHLCTPRHLSRAHPPLICVRTGGDDVQAG